MPSTRYEWCAVLVLALTLAGALVLIMGAGWPYIGFDFSYFLPRLIDVNLHQLQEGWFAVQWWTPSFGGGLPAFANPQHTQFMPAQFLLPLFGPWGAVVAQGVLCLVAGVYLVYYACRFRLGCGIPGSLLAAAAWGTNAFFWEHTLGGHIGFNSFPLIAILPHVLHRGVSPIRSVAVLGLIGALIVFTGGYTIIFIFALSGLLLGWLLPLLRPADFAVRTCFARLTMGGSAAAVVAAAKIVAVASFLVQFPRLADSAFSGPAWAGPGALTMQLFISRSFALASRWLPLSPAKLQAAIGEDVGFGPVVAIVLLAALAMAVRRRRLYIGSVAVAWVGLLLSIWFVGEIALGRGILWSLLKPLPFLRSLHVNDRFTAAFALPCVLLLAMAWQSLTLKWSRSVALVALSVALVSCFASLEPSLSDRFGFWSSGFDASTIQRTWDELKTHPEERFLITSIADVRDDATFLARASSWKPYEPIFGYGYGGVDFRVRITPGPVESIDAFGGAWRFHHPIAFVTPSPTGTDAFAPILASQADELPRFLARHQPGCPLSPMQFYANVLTLIALVGLCAAFVLSGRSSPKSRWRHVSFWRPVKPPCGPLAP